MYCRCRMSGNLGWMMWNPESYRSSRLQNLRPLHRSCTYPHESMNLPMHSAPLQEILLSHLDQNSSCPRARRRPPSCPNEHRMGRSFHHFHLTPLGIERAVGADRFELLPSIYEEAQSCRCILRCEETGQNYWKKRTPPMMLQAVFGAAADGSKG